MQKMTCIRYLVVVYVVTGGLDGEGLGSDEQEIVLIALVVVDLSNNKVVAVEQRVVKPGCIDINDNLLLDTCKGEYGLSEEMVKAAKPLEYVIEQFDQFVKTKLDVDYGHSFQFITDGQLHLRQVIHPEACSKNITLPHYYYSFFDLRKEFVKLYGSEEVHSIQDMLNYMGLEPDGSADLALRHVQNMARIILRLSLDGHKFEEPEIINDRLEPGICTKNELVDSNCVVRARGLPWQSSDQDIAKFFKGLNIVRGGVALCLSPQGRRNGEALVRFVNQEHRDMALKRHKHHIGQRYIEVYRATGEDFINVAGGSNNEAQAFLSRGAQVIVRMRGLPYDCTAPQVIEFFENGEDMDQVMGGEAGVLFVKKPDGRSTGDAFVLFETEEKAEKALNKHREVIGSRYIELFRSTTAEVQQVLNRSMDPRTYEPPQPLIGNLPPVSILPNQLIPPPTARKDCIRLRGLPYEAQVEHILEFLGEFAKNIVLQGVHMVYNAQAQPSGEAFIQMDSETSAYMAAQQRHHRYMVYGKKQRYIEVFQCSSDDMNLLMTGGLPVQRPLVSPGGNVLPTAYGAYPYIQPAQILSTAVTARIPAYYPSIIYWPYPSPPVSPTAYYSHSTPTMLTTDCVQLQRNNDVRATGIEADQNLQEKNRQNIGRRYIELFMA